RGCSGEKVVAVTTLPQPPRPHRTSARKPRPLSCASTGSPCNSPKPAPREFREGLCVQLWGQTRVLIGAGQEPTTLGRLEQVYCGWNSPRTALSHHQLGDHMRTAMPVWPPRADWRFCSDVFALPSSSDSPTRQSRVRKEQLKRVASE